MQTKYTASLAPAIFLIYAYVHRRLRLGLTGALIAGLVIVVWESALFLRYGESHFVYQLLHGDNGELPKYVLLGSLFPLLGGAAPFLTFLALAVLRARRWVLLVSALVLVIPFLLLFWPDQFIFAAEMHQLAYVVYACNGAMILLSVGWVAVRLVRASSIPVYAKPAVEPAAWFLVLWFALELVGYVLVSPFPAVRRIMGTSIAATLLIGYLADQTRFRLLGVKELRGVVAVTVLLGFGFFAVDFLEARAEQNAAYDAARLIRLETPSASIWYAGYWGFQYYAERSGMKQIVPLRDDDARTPPLLPPSRFQDGDWLVIPDEGIPQQELNVDRPELELKGELAVGDAMPLATLMNYYAGAVPLRHQRGPRIVLQLYRVKEEFIAR